MTFYQFDQLTYEVQLATVHETGTFLAMRWQAENQAVKNLYALPGRFSVEVTHDTAANELLGLRSFSSSEPLEGFAVSVRLPDWIGGES